MTADGDLPFLHRLQKGGLHLGGRTVDLVGEQEVDHHRAEFDVELLLALAVDAGTDDVGGHQVGSELDTREGAAHDLGERLDRQRLGDTGNALEQHMALGEQTHQHPLDELVLADDDPLDLEDGSLEGVHLLLKATVVGRRGVRAALSRGITLRGALLPGRGLPREPSGALRRPTR